MDSARTKATAGAKGRSGWGALALPFAGILMCVAVAAAPVPLRAETTDPSPPAADAAEKDRKWTAEELDTLIGRIALYPDALVAEILPASTFPVQVVEAARWLEAGKTVADGEKQPWDASVKALLRYPAVLKTMNADLRWTEELGQAFLAQPEDVLKSIQRMRQRAQALGNLRDQTRQRVIVDPDQTIIIAPPAAEPDVVYVPIYDPAIVFYQPPPPSGFWITYDTGYPLGIWIRTGVAWTVWRIVYGGWGYDWGWGSVYGGCCRGAVYRYTPTTRSRSLRTSTIYHWR
ncbi:MAG: DUF3300 domain-containing protein, partial [Rhodospirillaceae bacterium]|nr:DUF3300 domain-containing protein [Rhodospirillaceae bacterium]